MTALKNFLSVVFLLFFIGDAQAQTTSLVLGYSGSGISTDLRRVMDLEKIWEKHGLIIKSVYFNSGSVLTKR
jgi:ABC-type polar amino acid transport system ATPase subunit